MAKIGNVESADVAWDDRAVRIQPPLPRPPEMDSGFGPLLRRYGIETALDSRRRAVNVIFFKPLWTEPYSTFDAPHRTAFPKEGESSYEGGGPDTFEMIPHLLVIRRGTTTVGIRWAGEFRRIAGPVHAPRSATSPSDPETSGRP
ncbi:hypothetical protein EON77_17135 [bacterium]|nr:MAG: hypothetical protein EON77_17135 [bacterium]